jgi:hypothetical protein
MQEQQPEIQSLTLATDEQIVAKLLKWQEFENQRTIRQQEIRAIYELECG